MDRPNPFTPIPITGRARPLVLKRDKRAVNIEEHIAEHRTNAHIGTIPLNFREVAIVIIIIFSIIVARVAYLQIARGDSYRTFSEQNRTRLETIRAPRGIILDRSLEPLLENKPNFTLYVTPADLPRSTEERRALADTVVHTLSTLDPEKTNAAFLSLNTTSLQPLVLAEHIPYDQAIQISSAIARLPGVSLEAITTRSYSQGETSAHLIGYLGKPTEQELRTNTSLSTLSEVGRMGIELEYDHLLRGSDGVREVERDHLNKELAVIASKNPQPGKNLVLSIDRGLQTVLSRALREALQRNNLPGAAAVALDPRNGEIRALVSEPSFNPNLFTERGTEQDFQTIFEDPRHPLFFRPVAGTYPSGSTIKPLIAAAGLAEGVIAEHTTVESTGGITVGPNFFPDWKPGGHGTTDVRTALSESVNTFFYLVGGGFGNFQGLGVDRIVDYLKRFGLGEKLGIDLPDEASGFLPSKDWRSRPNASRWFLGDTYHLAIGQGYINVTPLQVASYTATVANGGTLFRPHLLQQILSAEGSLEQHIQPQAIRTTVPDQVLAVVRAGMRQAVTAGSARALSGVRVPVAAKTGTAQFGNEEKTHAWLTSFAPYERPEIVITVLIEEGGEGHATALPVAKEALDWYFNRAN